MTHLPELLPTTANLSDSLDAVGERHRVLAERLPCAIPGSRILGPARTVRFEPTDDVDPAKPYDDAIDFIDSIEPGEVVVIATGESNASAFWGELFSAAALGRGAVGMVTDGNLRDSDKIIPLGFAAFARSHRPIDYRGRMRVTAVQQNVEIGGVEIAPGDLVAADDDGVVVIPAAVADQVLTVARARMSSETSVLTDLVAGATLREVWERYRIL
ncbi:RraA family protein [Microcella sp.]|uniref:RraA family protein n=1 Tax=Microcella sp. TaxID=1913979 RepID=UPI0025D34076|nr:RraA family protein [Microcella sp.]